jgi:hypothetical protein
VSQGIDTLDKMARQLVALNGMMDEQFLVGLADKVHRGQEGRVLKGLNPGGKLYGYTNVPILSPTRPGKYGLQVICLFRSSQMNTLDGSLIGPRGSQLPHIYAQPTSRSNKPKRSPRTVIEKPTS